MKLKKMVAVALTMSMAAAMMPATAMAEEVTDVTEEAVVEVAEEAAAVAAVGGTEYATLAEAVAAAESGDKIVLKTDVKLTERITISEKLTLDLNSKKISAEEVADGYGAIYVGTKGDLIITGKGEIVGGDYAIGNYGTVTVENGTFSGADAALYNFYYNDSTYGKATIKDGKFENSLWNCGEMTIENGVFAELDNSGKATIKDGEIDNVIARDGSDAAGLDEKGTLVISGGTFGVEVLDAWCAPNMKGVKNENGTWTVAPDTTKVVAEVNGEYYEALADAVVAAGDRAEVTLLKSTEGAGIVINKPITIDFGGNTYTFTEPAVGSTGTTTNGFQILQESGKVTLMNGALEVADAHKDKYYILIQNYTDLTVKDMKLDGKNLDKWSGTDGDSYVLSNNHGDVVITGDTTIIANNNGDKAFAFDVCKFSTYEAPTVTFDAKFTGGVKGAFEVSEGLKGNLKIYAGYFTQDPTAYVAADKEAKEIDKDGYKYMVGEPASEPTPEPTPTPSTGGGSKSKPKYTASVDKNDVENGDVKLSSTRAKAGSKVTVTVTPDAGYELKKLVILDKDGNKVDVTDNGDGTFTFKMPKGGVEVVPTFVEAEEDADVSEEGADSANKEETVLVLTIDQRVYQQDGNYAVNDVAPIISGERTFLPIRLIAEALGATVSWENETQAVTIVDGDTTIVIYMGQPFATVNGTPIQLDAPAFITNGRTYLPVRFIAENLGATVNWDAEAKTVTIIG